MGCFSAVKVTDRVWWVGAVDWNLREFHGYRTARGSTYNAFLVLDDKVTLIDTVKAPFFGEMRDRIASVIDPAKIDYIISNHAEMDHSGALPRAIAEFQPEKVFCSVMGEKALKAHFGGELPVTAVKTGDTLSLGVNTVKFLETRMLHWPDSMASLLSGERVLFSQDAFGMHMAGSSRFASDYDEGLLYEETRSYFANILLVQAPKVAALLDDLAPLLGEVDVIAPDHGPVWREERGKVLEYYREFSAQKPEKRAVVLYDTMWHSTEKMAAAVADGISASGIPTEVISLHAAERSAAMARIMNAGILAVGTPTLNNNLYPSLADCLTYARGLRPTIAVGGAFGSFGWSGEGAKQAAEFLAQMKVEQPEPVLAVKYVPDEEALGKCREFGGKLAAALLAKLDA